MYAASCPSLDPLIRKLESTTSLSDEDRQAIESLPTRSRVLGPRQEIVRDGDRPSQCCIVLDGWLCRTKMLGDGRRQILSFHIPGDVPDLQSLHLPVMDHTLSTITQATVAFVAHDEFRTLVATRPAIAAALWRETLMEAAIFREWITGLGRRDAMERLAHLFCELYRELRAVGIAADHRCDLPITQAELGDALGLSTVHVNRTLQELRARELISLQGRCLHILDWPGLEAVAEFDPAYLQGGDEPLNAPPPPAYSGRHLSVGGRAGSAGLGGGAVCGGAGASY